MMVEECMSNDEVEDASFYNYNTICSNNDNGECAEQVNLDSDGYDMTLLTDMTNSRWYIRGGKTCMTM